VETVRVVVKRRPGTEDLGLPAYQTTGASGLDLLAAVEEAVTLAPGDIRLIPTGLYLGIPPGYEGQVRPRSGLALRQGLTVANTPGTIDSDYRGEVGVILVNLGREPVLVTRGMRIAQLVLQPVVRAELVEGEPEPTRRADGGFGHTGS
jgi:dUTP pyrophosphatase